MSYIQIGRVMGTWGLKGDIKVTIDTDFVKERYAKGSFVYIEDQGNYIKLEVERYRPNKGHLIVKFKGIDDINDIEKYKGHTVYKDQADIPPLEEGEYYFYELEGLDVIVEDEVVGKVIAVEEGVAYNYLRIKVAEDKTSLVPYIPTFIKGVDKEKGIIEIIHMEGLL